MAISRKKVLEKIAGLRKAIVYHLDKHVPDLIDKADKGLIEYWRKEVNGEIAQMEKWANRLSKKKSLLTETAQFRQRLEEMLDKRLQELGG